MGQTDRQTDKATHWNSAIYDSGDGFSGQWDVLHGPLPSFVDWVKTKKEICPTTGREHMQTHVKCHRQVRLSQLCGWIKHTKWKPVVGEEYIKNSISYIEKQQTTAPGAKVELLHGEKYLQIHELLLVIAKTFRPQLVGCGDLHSWDYMTAPLLEADLKWANKLSNPALRRMWMDWRWIFISKVDEYCEETGGAFIIEGTTSEGVPEECLLE